MGQSPSLNLVSLRESADNKTCLIELLLWRLNKVSHVQGKTGNLTNNFMYGKVVLKMEDGSHHIGQLLIIEELEKHIQEGSGSYGLRSVGLYSSNLPTTNL